MLYIFKSLIITHSLLCLGNCYVSFVRDVEVLKKKEDVFGKKVFISLSIYLKKSVPVPPGSTLEFSNIHTLAIIPVLSSGDFFV